jgi:general secretion pathway protein D
MVFLRPVVLRDAVSSEDFTINRYDMMRGVQQEAQPQPSVMVPVNDTPVLPPARPGTPPASLVTPTTPMFVSPGLAPAVPR